MNRIQQLFEKKQKGLLSIYFCAGSPQLENTLSIIETLEEEGVDFVEIGIPFSDPMADGVVIQEAANKALGNGMTLRRLFDQLREVRKTVQIPLILMGYLNPIMQYGFEHFCVSCQQVGIDGVIIPDLPFKDYVEEYKPIADRFSLKVIMLITPETSQERIHLIDQHTEGFIYMVSSAATTGAQKDFDTAKQAYFERIDRMKLRNPRMIGFGISNRSTFEMTQKYAEGSIIGSKFVQLLDSYNGDARKAIRELKEILKK